MIRSHASFMVELYQSSVGKCLLLRSATTEHTGGIGVELSVDCAKIEAYGDQARAANQTSHLVSSNNIFKIRLSTQTVAEK